MYDFEGEPIALGRRITVGNFFFPWLVSQSRPSGQLMAIDTKDEYRDPGHADLGSRVIIYYVPYDEMSEIIAAVLE